MENVVLNSGLAVPKRYWEERKAEEFRALARAAEESLRKQLVARTFDFPSSPPMYVDYRSHDRYSSPSSFLPPLPPPPTPRPRPKTTAIQGDFGIDADKMNLIRTKEVVGALTYVAQHDPSFTPDQQRRVRALAAELDRYGCGLARAVKLDERNAEGWLRRLEGLVASTIEADMVKKPQELEAPDRCPVKVGTA